MTKNTFTARKAAKMVADGKGCYAYFAVGPEGCESSAKRTREEADAVYPEAGHTVLIRLAVPCVRRVRGHVNPVGAQIYVDAPGTTFINIVEG